MNAIKKLRKKKKLNQVDFAKSLGISQGEVSKIESDLKAASVYVLKKLRAVYGFNVNKYLDETWI